MKKRTIVFGALASLTLAQQVDAVKLNKEEVTIVIPGQKKSNESPDTTNNIPRDSEDDQQTTEPSSKKTKQDTTSAEKPITSKKKEKHFPSGNPKIVNSQSSVNPAPPSDSQAFLGGWMGSVSESINR